jgi:beta-N-acetylhexosaminidase
MKFHGVVFSDDISMAAAEGAGGIGARITAHRDAGCDLVLVCKPDAVDEALTAHARSAPCDPAKVASLRGTAAQTWESLLDNPQRDKFLARIAALTPLPVPATSAL